MYAGALPSHGALTSDQRSDSDEEEEKGDVFSYQAETVDIKTYSIEMVKQFVFPIRRFGDEEGEDKELARRLREVKKQLYKLKIENLQLNVDEGPYEDDFTQEELEQWLENLLLRAKNMEHFFTPISKTSMESDRTSIGIWQTSELSVFGSEKHNSAKTEEIRIQKNIFQSSVLCPIIQVEKPSLSETDPSMASSTTDKSTK